MFEIVLFAKLCTSKNLALYGNFHLPFPSTLPPSLFLSAHFPPLSSFSSIPTPSSFFSSFPSPPAGSDYSSLMDFEFTMIPGQTFALISIPMINDDAIELTELVTANLSLISPITTRITVDPDEASVTIEDNDSEFCGGFYVMLSVTL